MVRLISWPLVISLFLTTVAYGKGDSNRLSLGVGSGSVNNENNQNVTDFRSALGYYVEVDHNEGIALHSELSGFGNQNVRSTLYSVPDVRTEMYFMFFGIGPKFYLPTPFVQPWFGGGGIFGHAVVSDPNDRTATNFTVVFDREFKYASGGYAHAGVDIYGAQFGFRLSYTHYYVRSDPFNSLNRESMNFHFERLSAGLLFLY